MWTVPSLYGLLLVLRLLPDDRALPRWTHWLPMLANVGAWIWFVSLATKKAALFGHGMTMSWGLFPLAVSLGAKWLDPKDDNPEFFDASLLIAALLSALWIASLGAQLPTPMSMWELSAVWLVDLGGGLLLLLALLSWHIAVNAPKQRARLVRGLTRLQILATASIMGALLCALPEASRLNLTQRGHLLFLLIALGGLWLPTILPKEQDKSFSRPALLWMFAGAAYTIAWALVRLFALV